jgi:hypothetical protein
MSDPGPPVMPVMLHAGDASTSSVAETAIVTATILLFAGQIADGEADSETMAGAVMSATEIVKVVGTATFPALSFAVHVTVVEPSPNVEPEAGAHAAVRLPSTASLVAGAS